MSIKFEIGSIVRVAGMRGTYQLIDGPNRKGAYLVSQGVIQFWVAVENITTPINKSARSAKSERNGRYTRPAQIRSPAVSSTCHSIDLHGFTIEQAIEAVNKHLSDVLIAGVQQFDIIHGIGTGAIKNAVHQCLASQPQVSRFAISPLNFGITTVYL